MQRGSVDQETDLLHVGVEHGVSSTSIDITTRDLVLMSIGGAASKGKSVQEYIHMTALESGTRTPLALLYPAVNQQSPTPCEQQSNIRPVPATQRKVAP